jgi:hypothetical protein
MSTVTYVRGTDFHETKVDRSVVHAFTTRLRAEGCTITRVAR